MADLLVIDGPKSEIRAGDGTGGLKLDPGASSLVTVTNGVYFPDGSVTNPSIVFDSDGAARDTGIYSSADENIDFTANGVRRVNIDGVANQINLYNQVVFHSSTLGISYNDLSDQPALFSGDWADLTGKPGNFAVGSSGFVPAPTADDTTKYLRGDGTWQTVSGGGGSLTIQDEGVEQGTATTINFTGDGVTATVSGGVATVNVAASGGGGGGVDAHTVRLYSMVFGG